MHTFLMCGWPAWGILFMTIVAMAFAFVAVILGFVKPRWALVVAVLALVTSCSVPGVGVFGTWRGRTLTEGAISGASITPEQRERIRTEGYAEAATCTTLGGVGGALPILLSLVALGIAFARRKAQ